MSAETNTARSPESSSNTKALEWVTIRSVLVVAFDHLWCVAALGFVILKHEGTGMEMFLLLLLIIFKKAFILCCIAALGFVILEHEGTGMGMFLLFLLIFFC